MSWAFEHPYLTFVLLLFCIFAVGNIVVTLIKAFYPEEYWRNRDEDED